MEDGVCSVSWLARLPEGQEGMRELCMQEPWPWALTNDIPFQLNPSSLGLSFPTCMKGRLYCPSHLSWERSVLSTSGTKCTVLGLVTKCPALQGGAPMGAFIPFVK